MTASTPSSGSIPIRSYTLNRWDLFHSQLFAISRNRVAIFMWVAGSLSIAWTALQSPALTSHSLFVKGCVVGVFALVSFTLFVATTTVVAGALTLAGKYHGVLGEHTLEITQNGLIERTEYNETLIRWNGIHRTVKTPKYLYLWVNELLFPLVPLRSFETEEAARLFQSEIEKHRTAALGSVTVRIT